jgi:hypothetical protein
MKIKKLKNERCGIHIILQHLEQKDKNKIKTKKLIGGLNSSK